MSSAIYMPVAALNKDCAKCPELNIIATRFYSGDEIMYYSLKCEHYERCCHIRDSLLAREKNIAIDEEKDMGV